MSRFEDVTSDVNVLVSTIQTTEFPALNEAVILVLFDTKKRKTGGRYIMGRIKKANDEIKVLATDENGISPDYIMFLDKLVWDSLEESDRKRIVHHELCHCETNFESDTNQYKIRDHEIQTFYSEISYNDDDPRWLERVSAVAESVHDPDMDN